MKVDFKDYLPSTRFIQRITPERDSLLAALPRLAILPRPQQELPSVIEDVPNLTHRKTGTTVLGMRFFDPKVEKNNFTVLAGDRRVTWGWYILSHDTIKTTPISSHSAVAAAGTSGIIELIERRLKHELQIFEDEYEMELPVPSHAKVLQNIIRQYLPLFIYAWDLASVFIFAGYDNRSNVPFKHRPVLVWFDDIGGSSEAGSESFLPYAALGSGMKEAHAVLDDELTGWRPNMTREEAITLAVRAIWASGKRDPGTETRTVPTILIIDASGINVVSEDDIYRIISAIMETRRKVLKRQGGNKR